jgi:hypothetical protein
MSHLHPERLAALADGEPTPNEAAHLASCALCAREMGAHRRLLLLAWRERESVVAPLSDWDSLADAARGEGLIRDRQTPARVQGWAWVQAAAAVVLVAGGIAIGRQSVPAEADQVATTAEPSLVRNVSANDSTITFASPAEAIRVLARAEQEYRLAMLYLSGRDSVTRVGDDPAVYRARLAALDQMTDVALEAVREAPADPLVNRIYLNALGYRDATIRQLGEKLPENVQLVGF